MGHLNLTTSSQLDEPKRVLLYPTAEEEAWGNGVTTHV
jgi:hypothetical protein